MIELFNGSQEMIGRFIRLLTLLVLPVLSYGQHVIPDEVRVDYTALKKELSKTIVDLSRESKVNITFNPSILPADSLVSISARNEPLGLILNKILKGTKCIYKIVGNQLVIVRDPFIDAKQKITISGYLRDSISGEPLVFANVYLLHKQAGTTTNDYGFYSFSVDKGIQRVYFSYLGYKRTILELALVQDTILNIELEPDATLNEVLILDSQRDAQEKELYSADVLAMDKIWSMASLAGESDVIRYAQLMSGVSTGADGFGGLNVRGGSADQNLILLDGVPVYENGHALGIFSIFNSSTIKSAKLIKGAFPARYGGRLSSVLDVRTKEGSNKKMQGDITIGALTAKASIEGPLSKGSSSYLFSVRRTFLDPWIKDITSYINRLDDKTGEANIYFYDLNGKLNFKLGESSSLFISAYSGKDELNNSSFGATSEIPPIHEESILESEWGNNILSVRWNTKLSQKAFNNTTFYTSTFKRFKYDNQEFIIDADTIFTASLFKSRIQDFGIKSDFDYIPNNHHFLRFGFGLLRHQFDPGFKSFTNLDSLGIKVTSNFLNDVLEEPNIRGEEYTAYIEDEIRFSDHFRMNLGFRSNMVKTDTATDVSYEPRLSLILENGGFFFKAGVSRMSQYLHLLSSSGLGVPTDIWIPSTDFIKPERSWIYTAGFGFTMFKDIEVQIEGYYKELEKIVSFDEGVPGLIEEGSGWDIGLPVGDGTSYGYEVNVNKSYGKAVVLMNYTWSDTKRKFISLNQGREFPFSYDRRHQFKFGYIQKLNKNAEFTLNWLYGSGSPVSVPQTYTLIDGKLILLYKERNGELLLPYHRLDLAFNFYNAYSWAKQKFSIGLYNAYDRRNPFYVKVGTDEVTTSDFKTVQYSILPIIPSISYSLSF